MIYTDTKGVAVPMIDLGDFLRRHVRPVNFVVVKLDGNYSDDDNNNNSDKYE